MEGNKKGHFLGLVPLICFLVIYFACGIGTGSFDKMPLMIGISIAVIIAFFLNNKDNKISFLDKVKIFCKGGGDDTLILMVIIFLLAGAFYSVAGEMGAVSSVTNLCLKILPGRLILPGLFVIGCILSFSMGTSMGTVAALMPIAIDLSSKIGVDVALLGGIVVGGAMFGDNLSFISDTTIAATRTQDVEMKDKFKANILMVLPAVVVNIIILIFVPIQSLPDSMDLTWKIWELIPYVLIITLSLCGVHVMPAMLISVLTGVVIGAINHAAGLPEGFTILESLTVIHTGMKWMEDMALIAVLVGGLVALMKALGGIDWLLNALTKNTKSARGGELSIAGLVSLLDIATTNNTISIIAAGPLARNIGDKFGIDRRRIASILDIFSSAFNGLMPYAGQLLTAAALASISPTDIMPYVWYCMLMLVFGVIFIIIGFPKRFASKKVETTQE